MGTDQIRKTLNGFSASPHAMVLGLQMIFMHVRDSRDMVGGHV